MKIISKKEARDAGLTRYFTGKPCPKGHVTERMVSNGDCKGCIDARKKTPEYKAVAAVHRRKYYLDNREDQIARAKAWAVDNPERRRDTRRERHQRDSRHQDRHSAWKKENAHKNREHEAARRARKRGTEIASERAAIQEFYRNCPVGYEVDHIIPLSKGGPHTLANLQYLPELENRRKYNKI